MSEGEEEAVGGSKSKAALFAMVLGCNSIDIFVGPESGPLPGPSHVWSFETCLKGCPSFATAYVPKIQNVY